MRADHPLIKAFARVSFSPGTASKRFAQDMCAKPADYELSERAEAFAWRVGYTFRRQLPNALRVEAMARKVAHKPVPGDNGIRWKCSVCERWLPQTRDLNAPCPGVPMKKEKKSRAVRP